MPIVHFFVTYFLLLFISNKHFECIKSFNLIYSSFKSNNMLTTILATRELVATETKKSLRIVSRRENFSRRAFGRRSNYPQGKLAITSRGWIDLIPSNDFFVLWSSPWSILTLGVIPKRYQELAKQTLYRFVFCHGQRFTKKRDKM
jgi:hypothetical protein